MSSHKTPSPTNNLVSPLLTDLYQITMVYSHWKNDRHNDEAVFELFFRKNPFRGGYTVFAGLDECLKHLSNFKFSESDLAYLRNIPSLSHCDPSFFDEYLSNLDCSKLQVFALQEGTITFPKVPLLTIVGPLGIGQLIETTLLNLVNFPSLIATNACRMVVAARGGSIRDKSSVDSKHKFPLMAEFGLRRSQGPDGGFTASKYSVLGGFDATSNVQAGKMLGIPVVGEEILFHFEVMRNIYYSLKHNYLQFSLLLSTGTNAHAYVQSYISLDEVKDVSLESKDGKEKIQLLPKILSYRNFFLQDDLLWSHTNDGELAAFISYASAFPDSFACIVDTYDTIKSGVRNFILVSLVLDDLGYEPRSIRLDSGDLAALSIEAFNLFNQIALSCNRPFLKNIDIVASNDLNESRLHDLNKKGHAITIYGIGTNLVTCQEQPALGCVYKLVELDGKPRMKLSNEIEKVLIPGCKCPYRLFGKNGEPLIDLMIGKNEDNLPVADKKILCRHPFVGQKRVYAIASNVQNLHQLVFDKEKGVVIQMKGIQEAKNVSQCIQKS